MLTSGVLIDSDPAQRRWIEIAFNYLPEGALKGMQAELAVIAIGRLGACRLPDQYRERELVLIADWLFPSAGNSEGDDTGRLFIFTLLHEIAHAVCRHKSPLLDKLSPETNQAQEDEADQLAVAWFNQHIGKQENEYLKTMRRDEFRHIIDRFSKLFDEMEGFKMGWHREHGT